MLIIDASLHHEATIVVAFVVLASLLTFIPLIRIWSEAFWKARPLDADLPHGSDNPSEAKIQSGATNLYIWVPVLSLSALMLLFGFLPGTIIELSDTAAQGLLTPSAYLESVMQPLLNSAEVKTQ